MNRLIEDAIQAHEENQMIKNEACKKQAFEALRQAFGEYVDDSIENTSDSNVFKIKDTEYTLEYDDSYVAQLFHLLYRNDRRGVVRSLGELGE